MCAVYFLLGRLCFVEADNELHDWKIFSRDESDKIKNICKSLVLLRISLLKSLLDFNQT